VGKTRTYLDGLSDSRKLAFDGPTEVTIVIRSYCGKLPVIPASCYVDISAQVLGEVTLGERSSVWMNAVLRGDVHSIRVGSNSNVQDCCVLHGQRNLYSVTVGDWVTIGHNATVHGCVVEDAVLIGMGVTILNDCRIGEGSIVAAGCVLPEHTVVPPRTLWAGVPGKLRRELGEEDRKLILEYAQNYIDYVDIYLNEGQLEKQMAAR
jgi:carbonic anhydrase/acetyltransferase-like protein (isoleucine patch superfamily)